MAVLRHALGFVTASWLILQAALLIVPAVTLLADSREETALECTCTHGSHAMCPMHHRPAPGSKVCLIGNADDSLATLASLLHVAGLLPAAAHLGALTFALAPSIDLAATITYGSVLPESPPPRA